MVSENENLSVESFALGKGVTQWEPAHHFIRITITAIAR
jgi:hypothetical protein